MPAKPVLYQIPEQELWENGCKMNYYELAEHYNCSVQTVYDEFRKRGMKKPRVVKKKTSTAHKPHKPWNQDNGMRAEAEKVSKRKSVGQAHGEAIEDTEEHQQKFLKTMEVLFKQPLLAVSVKNGVIIDNLPPHLSTMKHNQF